MCETVRSTSSMRSRFQLLRMLRKCSSCSLFMYASPRLVMYGVTLRGPASRLPASSDSSASSSFGGGARRGSDASRRRDAIRGHDDALGRWRLADGLGNGRGAGGWLGAGAGFTATRLSPGARRLGAAGALVAAGFAAVLAATGFVAGFFAVNLGFSAFFGLAGFAAARLVGIVCRSRPESRRGAGLQDAGLYRRVFACTVACASRHRGRFLTKNQGNCDRGAAAVQPGLRRSTTTVV